MTVMVTNSVHCKCGKLVHYRLRVKLWLPVVCLLHRIIIANTVNVLGKDEGQKFDGGVLHVTLVIYAQLMKENMSEIYTMSKSSFVNLIYVLWANGDVSSIKILTVPNCPENL